jgi:hypothetical protein
MRAKLLFYCTCHLALVVIVTTQGSAVDFAPSAAYSILQLVVTAFSFVSAGIVVFIAYTYIYELWDAWRQ